MSEPETVQYTYYAALHRNVPNSQAADDDPGRSNVYFQSESEANSWIETRSVPADWRVARVDATFHITLLAGETQTLEEAT